MPKLVMLSEEMSGREFAVDGDRLKVGRAAGNDIWIEDVSVSGQHAELRKEGDTYVLRDLNSTNGTRVNGESVSGEHRLKTGDEVQFGRIVCRFDVGASRSTRRPPPIKKGIDLQTVAKSHPTTVFQNVSPFRHKGPGRSGKLVQAAIITFAVIAVIMFAILLYTFMHH